jgi:hypothetical protein
MQRLFRKPSDTEGQSIDNISYVTVGADVSGLGAGTHNCQLTISADDAFNSPKVVDVNFVIYGPEIELSATHFEFDANEGGANPEDQILTIRNNGGGILNWESIYDCNWLEVIPRAGASRGDIIEVTLSVDISHLTWGNYDCELKILDPNAENSPLTVTVDLYVFVGDLVQVPSQAPTIQDAVDYVREGGTVVVADRVYTGRGNRDIDFKGKAITVRSENGPTNCIIDCQDSLGNGHHRGFYFHSGEDENSVLDGFMIINGSAVGCSVVQGGGAILCQSSSPTIANCIIRGNRTGGCIILESYGGGIALDKSSARISRCIISGNWAYEAGGGIICAEGSPIISNCIITGHSAEHGAGAAFIRSSPILTNCTFSANERDGVCCFSNSYIMIVTNSIFWDNAGPEIWLGTYTATMTISYSNVEDLTAGIHVEPDSTLNWGAGNISMDPCFVSMGHWDSNDTQMPYDDFWVDGYYHLKSQGGRWDTAIGSWIKDDVTSPCIDAGDPMSPVGLEPFPNGGRINMGAYGGTAEASKSYFGEPVCETIVAGDINGDCKVDFADFTIMAFHWLEDGRL